VFVDLGIRMVDTKVIWKRIRSLITVLIYTTALLGARLEVGALTMLLSGTKTIKNAVSAEGPALRVLTLLFLSVVCLCGSGVEAAGDNLDTTSRLQIQIPQTFFRDEGYDHREALFGIPNYVSIKLNNTVAPVLSLQASEG
jgi:hypothetical protein